jgi:tRNA pseudouridine38-40 synthase
LFYRYFIQLSYKGTHYHGWQIQPNAITVQEILNQKLSLLLNQEIYAIGAGRTDTGVHAPFFIAHFDTSGDITNQIPNIIHKLNCILPTDISIQSIFRVRPDSHARFSAISRTYIYRISQYKNPFTQDVAYFFSKSLDIEKMNQAASILFEYNDFTSFAKLHSDAVTNNCKILEAEWKKSDSELVFQITADRFLRNMVRAITGTLLKIGENKLSVNNFREIIESKNRSNAGTSIHAHGLHLVDIKYPETIYLA